MYESHNKIVSFIAFQVFSEYGGAITLDFWSDDYHKNPYLSITGHYIDDKWELKNVLLGVFPWKADQRQTGENVYAFLTEVNNMFFVETFLYIIYFFPEIEPIRNIDR